MNLSPFLYQLGAKAWLSSWAAIHLKPEHVAGGYLEPMVGGGSLLIYLLNRGWLRPPVVLNDLNILISRLWQAAILDPERLALGLMPYQDVYSRTHFNEVREELNEQVLNPEEEDPIWYAIRFLYLNTRCFRGITRMAKGGWFNAPYGHFDPGMRPIRIAMVYWLGCFLQDLRATCYHEDFEITLRERSRGTELVFLDAPYDKTFDAYTPEGFVDRDRVRLANWFYETAQPVISTDSVTPFTRELYSKSGTELVYLRRPGGMSDGQGRGRTTNLGEQVAFRLL